MFFSESSLKSKTISLISGLTSLQVGMIYEVDWNHKISQVLVADFEEINEREKCFGLIFRCDNSLSVLYFAEKDRYNKDFFNNLKIIRNQSLEKALDYFFDIKKYSVFISEDQNKLRLFIIPNSKTDKFEEGVLIFDPSKKENKWEHIKWHDFSSHSFFKIKEKTIGQSFIKACSILKVNSNKILEAI